MGLATGTGDVPVGAAVGQVTQVTNAALVTGVAAGAAVVVVTANVEPEGRAEGGSVDVLAQFSGQVDGQAVNAQQAILLLEANVAGAGFAFVAGQEIEKVLAGTVNHDAFYMDGIVRIPRGTIAAGAGAVIQGTVQAIGQNQDVPALRGRLTLTELSDIL
jgi:hypothetical protein